MILILCFNPAEAREGFKTLETLKNEGVNKVSSFNPAEAREGFKTENERHTSLFSNPCFNPAEAREGFKTNKISFYSHGSSVIVSIQPKPEKGLRHRRSCNYSRRKSYCFNPAEAREGFKTRATGCYVYYLKKSFNPAEAREGFKTVIVICLEQTIVVCFNPAEAREGFKTRHCLND